MAGSQYLNGLADMAHERNFITWLSTNGDKKDVVEQILPNYDLVHVTVSKAVEALKWLKVNCLEHLSIKLTCDSNTTLKDFKEFAQMKFPHKSMIVYHDLNTAHPKELPLQKELKDFLDKSASWDITSEEPYLYREIDGVIVKRPVEGFSIFTDDIAVPKIYPNGNYGNSWTTEEPQQLFTVNKG